MPRFESDDTIMQRAMELACRGLGHVEPNPPVGAVIVTPEGELIAEGWHRRFGGPHAEVEAIRAAGERTRGAVLFVTLEPCNHTGKTPPCTDAVIAAGFQRVVIGCHDPAKHASSDGAGRLRAAGMEVVTGVCESECRRLIAPFERLHNERRPWVQAKWAMTLDGRMASRTGHSQWISSAASRAIVHELRGRMDAIVTGAGTVRADDPLLTARPAGPRIAVRVVCDSSGMSLSRESKLVQSIAVAPVLVCVTDRCPAKREEQLRSWGCEVFRSTPTERDTTAMNGTNEGAGGGDDPRLDLSAVLRELGRRQCTHVLLEAGPSLLGAFFDGGLIDEVHVFIAPKLLGGEFAASPLGGLGLARVPDCPTLTRFRCRPVGDDVLIEADVAGSAAPPDFVPPASVRQP
jgi:diaminohydroxyphosphoribosylaminopyrimidine deaminase/5-amino-6-(5-phosphoribosylamino)uracil reductase